MFKAVGINILAPCILLACAESAVETSAQSKQIIELAKGAIVRADGPEAVSLLTSLGEDDLAPEDHSFLTCATERLSMTGLASEPDMPNAFVKEILLAFRAYWRAAIIDPDTRTQAERNLARQISTILQIDDFSLIESTLIERLRAEGFYGLMGRTGQLRELMIWSSQTEERKMVQLPEGEVVTDILYLDGFISTGWSSYFACDTIGTGGWATSDGLHVVVPRWESLEDERFRISLLAHESQHFQDYTRFPDLAGWELEYRAKLVELALADEGQNRLIERFTSNQGEDTSDPHSYANKEVLAALRTHLNLAASDDLKFDSKLKIQKAAETLLRRDSHQRLESAGRD